MWGNNKDPRPPITEYLRDVMTQIGFKAKTKILDQQVYFGTIGLKKTKAQAGFTDWFSDFPHPGGLLRAEPLEEGARRPSRRSTSSSRATRSSTRRSKELGPASDPKSVADKWAEVDKSIIDNADIAPVYGNELST